MELSAINDKLINLPGEIASKERELEIAKVDTKVSEARVLTSYSRLGSQDLRKAQVDSDSDVIRARKNEGVLKSEYHGLINAFQGIQELARNVRSEMRSLKDGM